MKNLKWIMSVILLLSFLIPVSAFAFFRPMRVIAPEIFGIHCQSENLCVEDPGRYDQARSLVIHAKEFLAKKWGLRIGTPKVIFCSTEKCAITFGMGKKGGYTFGRYGIVISPRAWRQYYVAHEMLHVWQSENFGSLILVRGKPWVIAGMAYALSFDPRPNLSEPYQTYRSKFRQWYKAHTNVPLKSALREVL